MRGARLLGAAGLVVPRPRWRTGSAPARGGRRGGRAFRYVAGTARRWCRRRRPGSSSSGLSPATRCCSGAAAEVQACAKALVRYEIVPGVPAVTGVPPYAGIALTADSAGELRVVHANEVSQVGYAAGTLGGPRRGDRARRPRQDADRGGLAGCAPRSRSPGTGPPPTSRRSSPRSAGSGPT